MVRRSDKRGRDVATNILASVPPMPPMSISSTSESSDSAPIGYLALFNQYISQKNISVEWVFETHTGRSNVTDALLAEGEGSEATPVWVVRAVMGERGAVGAGKGRTKKAAKNDAAKEALAVLGVQMYEASNGL